MPGKGRRIRRASSPAVLGAATLQHDAAWRRVGPTCGTLTVVYASIGSALRIDGQLKSAGTAANPAIFISSSGISPFAGEGIGGRSD